MTLLFTADDKGELTSSAWGSVSPRGIVTCTHLVNINILESTLINKNDADWYWMHKPLVMNAHIHPHLWHHLQRYCSRLELLKPAVVKINAKDAIWVPYMNLKTYTHEWCNGIWPNGCVTKWLLIHWVERGGIYLFSAFSWSTHSLSDQSLKGQIILAIKVLDTIPGLPRPHNQECQPTQTQYQHQPIPSQSHNLSQTLLEHKLVTRSQYWGWLVEVDLMMMKHQHRKLIPTMT